MSGLVGADNPSSFFLLPDALYRRASGCRSAWGRRDHVSSYWHEQYLKISEGEWTRRITKRNMEKPDGTYYVDEGLLRKVEALFQEPEPDESDIIPLEFFDE